MARDATPSRPASGMAGRVAPADSSSSRTAIARRSSSDRAVGAARLDALEHQPVEQREEAAGHGVDVEPGRQLAAGDALGEDVSAGPDQSLAPRRQHLADAGLAVRLRPGLEQRDLPRRALVLVDRLDVQPDGDGHPLGRGRGRREAFGELVETLGGDLVAAQPDQLILAGEVGVDRADRQPALAHDVRDRRAVVALLAEHAKGGGQDAVPDLLLVGGADARHSATPKTNVPSPQSSGDLRVDASLHGLTKRMIILYLRGVRSG